MKLTSLTKRFASVGRWLATMLFCVSAIALGWQSNFSSAAIADPAPNLIAAADVGSQVQGKTSKDSGRAKNFIRDTKNQVQQTAKNNAARVDQATDNDGSFLEGKAKRDAARINKRAEEDAARTQEAVDSTKNVIERTVDSIKDTFSG